VLTLHALDRSPPICICDLAWKYLWCICAPISGAGVGSDCRLFRLEIHPACQLELVNFAGVGRHVPRPLGPAPDSPPAGRDPLISQHVRVATLLAMNTSAETDLFRQPSRNDQIVVPDLFPKTNFRCRGAASPFVSMPYARCWQGKSQI